MTNTQGPTSPNSDESREHVLSSDCWCNPTVISFAEVKHQGDTNIQIPREAVDAAARALGNHIELDFDLLAPVEQHQARESAIAALNAAIPHLIAVARAQIVDEIKTFLAQADEKPTGSDVLSHVTRQETLAAIEAARRLASEAGA